MIASLLPAAQARWRAVQQRLADRLVRAQGVAVGAGVVFDGIPIVSLVPGSTIELGDKVHICSNSRGTDLGVNHPTVLRTLAPGARLVVGPDVGISGGAIIAAIEVTIGAGTLIGANVTIADTDFHPTEPIERRHAPMPTPQPQHRVSIGRNVFVGTGAIVLKGTTIEDDAVVGAGAVVTGHVARGQIVAGNPARPIGSGS